MVVILAGNQVLSPRQVCQGCLLADRSGLPRLQDGYPTCCGKTGEATNHHAGDQAACMTVECPMGFRVARLGD
jgi:hypothetical protein